MSKSIEHQNDIISDCKLSKKEAQYLRSKKELVQQDMDLLREDIYCENQKKGIQISKML
jgi:hypothetical protein